jgi:hypothetical protein
MADSLKFESLKQFLPDVNELEDSVCVSNNKFIRAPLHHGKRLGSDGLDPKNFPFFRIKIPAAMASLSLRDE